MEPRSVQSQVWQFFLSLQAHFLPWEIRARQKRRKSSASRHDVYVRRRSRAPPQQRSSLTFSGPSRAFLLLHVNGCVQRRPYEETPARVREEKGEPEQCSLVQTCPIPQQSPCCCDAVKASANAQTETKKPLVALHSLMPSGMEGLSILRQTSTMELCRMC